MGRRPINPAYVDGEQYPARDAQDIDEIAERFEPDFPSARAVIQLAEESDADRTRVLLAELRRLRERLTGYEHIVIQYALNNGVATQRQIALSQNIGRTQVQQLWREPVPYREP